MRIRQTTLVALGFGAAAVCAAQEASAQIDVNPPIPNVLLLVDTSGSMEDMIDGSHPEDNAQPNNACTPNTTTNLNRWATLVSVLTGSISNFSCQKVARDATFASEYNFNGAQPYDLGYYLPFHRILSNGCAIGPGTPPSNWYDWPATPFNQHDYTNVTTHCSQPFTQQPDGLLDTFRDRVRFGLMTFDSLVDPSTGASGTSPDAAGGELGTWSYFPNWQSGGAPVGSCVSGEQNGVCGGNPPQCTMHPYEVGARNPAAPPWEGRMIPFGPYDANLANVEQTNDHIQQVILAMRPYGATPIAGMLTDAQYFLLNDNSIDPSTGQVFGPGTDPYFNGGCRKTFIILLTDGQPNMDLRPYCAQKDPSGGNQNGVCPYDLPENVAFTLANNTQRPVDTYVIGFGLSTEGPSNDCTKLTITDVKGPTCANATGALKACCELTNIAYNGGTTNAFFANDITGLRTQLSQVLAQISQGSTARTVPVFATATSAASNDANLAPGGTGTAGFQFLSSFNAPAGGQLWLGNLERERYVCETQAGVLAADLQNVDSTIGDDFAADLNSGQGPARQFLTYVETKDTQGNINAVYSQRPNVTTDDGLGLTTGNVVGLQTTPAFIASIATTPEVLGIPSASPPVACSATFLTTSAAICATRLMNWELGISNAAWYPATSPTPLPTRLVSECPSNTQCSLLGSIYHSTPAIVGAPHDFLQDESYEYFASPYDATTNPGGAGLRPTMLYTATTDGQLHAFKVAAGDPKDTIQVDSLANNEMWSFLPPHVMPSLLPTYNQQSILTDGAPVVKDVIFERTKGEALQGYGSGSASWHTVLVAGGGEAGGFYYALEVTDPTNPRFLWQLSTDASGNPLFGDGGVPQPAIATVSLQDTNNNVKEVAVAILAGGSTTLRAGTCATSAPTTKLNLGIYKARAAVQCWGPQNALSTGPARSVTIVRLDTGQVLQTFRGVDTDGPPNLTTGNKIAQDFSYLTSPMSGVPVPFPSQVGQVSDRAYIGDADGQLWRIDLSNADPSQWTIELAWDAYSLATQEGDTATTGQPIETPPIVSVDDVGNPVILFSTGDQELFTTSTPVTRVWSLSEKPNGTTYQISPNWVIPFKNGKRVTGAIALFNGAAYFSTYTPSISGQPSCYDGYGSVWGVDYLQGTAGADGNYPNPQYVADPINAPLVKVAECANPAPGTCASSPTPDASVVFGVGVTETPACQQEINYNDPFLGQHTAISQASGNTFELVFQTGKGGAAQNGARTNSVTQQLPTPQVTTRIDSWASVVE